MVATFSDPSSPGVGSTQLVRASPRLPTDQKLGREPPLRLGLRFRRGRAAGGWGGVGTSIPVRAGGGGTLERRGKAGAGRTTTSRSKAGVRCGRRRPGCAALPSTPLACPMPPQVHLHPRIDRRDGSLQAG
ncbi:hypothetical protein BRADI_5g07156v3 [Brachypodium distachyon]|uniref:Uncharacterized protein n=1 Tax=Brachypodium distachyon TaxID=15368 RepID=A0A2K2CFR1_BRADI|nr:hypothetical protein BRADI_5g07156v3 [Brachypodium distachyon]